MNMEDPYKDEPYSLKLDSERQRRLEMLGDPHIAPLIRYLADIKAEHPEKELPYFDPRDGGVNVKTLFLLEAPGPKAVDSAFISRNNPDPSARNFFNLLQEAKISRADTVLWNIVPWYVGDGGRIRPVNDDDIRESLPYLKGLLALLPNLKVIILVGKRAQSAKGQIRQLNSLPIIETHHPSARSLNVWPHKREDIKKHLLQVAAAL